MRLAARIAVVALVVISAFVALEMSFSGDQPNATAQEKSKADLSKMLVWDKCDSFALGSVGDAQVLRTKVPGGWLVSIRSGDRQNFHSIAFYPDPDHSWDGTSVK